MTATEVSKRREIIDAKRIKRVSISNDGDCIKIIPKGWIDKKVWREINDILRLSEFSWLSNGKDGCWMKLLS